MSEGMCLQYSDISYDSVSVYTFHSIVIIQRVRLPISNVVFSVKRGGMLYSLLKEWGIQGLKRLYYRRFLRKLPQNHNRIFE